MLLHLDPHTRIRQLNRLLALQFPFLKLEFYQQKSKMQPPERMSEQATLADVNQSFLPGVLTINSHDTVADVERRFMADHKLQTEVLRKVISAQEDERRRIGRELHDETSQSLAALAIRLETLAKSTTDPEVQERVQ